MQQRLLITDSDPVFCQALKTALCGEFYVECHSDGHAALEAALRIQPELMVLDLTLPGMDGITLLKQLREASLPTMVLATTVFTSHYVIRSLESLNVQYLVRKPCTAEVLVQHIRILSQISEAMSGRIPKLCNQISDNLHALGFSPKLCGYAYLISGILLILCQPDIRTTKELYPYIARLHNTTGVLVERSIRNALATAWKHRDPAVWQIYFPSETTRNKCPTNRVFMTQLADCLHRTLQACVSAEDDAALPCSR